MANRSINDARQLRGVFPALFTPLRDDDPKRLRNSIDYEKTKSLIDDLVASGASGLVPVGTTGQSATLSHDQHVEFVRFVFDYAGGRIPVIAGAGSNSTRESIEMINRIQKEVGEAAFLCVTGYYNNPVQEGLVRHYRTISAETGAKIVIYNVPSRTCNYLEAETLIELSRDPNIIGLKQAVDFRSEGKHRDDTARVVRETSANGFAVVSGEDDGIHALLELGGTGVISATANIPEAAKLMLRLVEAHCAGERDKAKLLQEEALPFVRTVFLRKNPIPLGALFNSPLYLPLVSVRETAGGEEAQRQILKFIEESAPSLRKYQK